jgi:hypothetical protein
MKKKIIITESQFKFLVEEQEREIVNEGWLSDIGHFALDLGGMIPVVGNLFDMANAAWYLKEYNETGEKTALIFASLSAMAAIPVVGTVIGGFKLTKSFVGTPKFLQMLTKLKNKFGPLDKLAERGAKMLNLSSKEAKQVSTVGKSLDDVAVKSITKNKQTSLFPITKTRKPLSPATKDFLKNGAKEYLKQYPKIATAVEKNILKNSGLYKNIVSKIGDKSLKYYEGLGKPKTLLTRLNPLYITKRGVSKNLAVLAGKHPNQLKKIERIQNILDSDSSRVMKFISSAGPRLSYSYSKRVALLKLKGYTSIAGWVWDEILGGSKPSKEELSTVTSNALAEAETQEEANDIMSLSDAYSRDLGHGPIQNVLTGNEDKSALGLDILGLVNTL